MSLAVIRNEMRPDLRVGVACHNATETLRVSALFHSRSVGAYSTIESGSSGVIRGSCWEPWRRVLWVGLSRLRVRRGEAEGVEGEEFR